MSYESLWKKEDWWAVWLGLGIVAVAILAFYSGSTIKPVAVYPPKWSDFSAVQAHFIENWLWYIIQYIMWAVVFTFSSYLIGFDPKEYLPSFTFVYIVSVIIAVLSRWKAFTALNLEAPLVSLIIGLMIGNFIALPKWMDSGFRVEYYIKTGIVMLGATLPFSLIAYAGPIAFVQATIVAITMFIIIYFAATRFLELDRRFAACLGAGGAVCGVSAAIAMAAAVKAKREHVSMAITVVILWAMVFIFVLPFAAGLLNLHPGVAGAWIGTSEFADAAGFAAATQYGSMYETKYGFGEDEAIWAFTLMKVLGRDIWIGLWAFIMAIIAISRWELREEKPSPAEIWYRFPKFVVGFLVASAIITVISSGYTLAEYNSILKPLVITPIKTLRSWTFIFTFFSIGLTTRFRELAASGIKPFSAFTAGVAINVVLGFVLSTVIFVEYWMSLTP